MLYGIFTGDWELIRIYSVGVWNEIINIPFLQEVFELEFTPLEFETKF